MEMDLLKKEIENLFNNNLDSFTYEQKQLMLNYGTNYGKMYYCTCYADGFTKQELEVIISTINQKVEMPCPNLIYVYAFPNLNNHLALEWHSDLDERLDWIAEDYEDGPIISCMSIIESSDKLEESLSNALNMLEQTDKIELK